MAEEQKALSCPFCGGRSHHILGARQIRMLDVVKCLDCFAEIQGTYEPESALSKWNTRAHLPSQGGEAVEVVGYLYKAHSGVYSQMPGDELEPLMTVAQHQRILAASVGSAEPVAWAICKEPCRVDWLSATYANKRAAEAHVASYKNDLTLHITPLYTHPADQVADDLTMVKVSRELLERAAHWLEMHSSGGGSTEYFCAEELRALLAAASPQ